MKRLMYTQQHETGHKCENCNHSLSIMTATYIPEEGENRENVKDTKNVKKQVFDTTYEEELKRRVENRDISIEEAKREFSDPERLEMLIFYCKNCDAEYFYETPLYLEVDEWKKENPDATEEEIQEYIDEIQNVDMSPYPEYRLK